MNKMELESHLNNIGLDPKMNSSSEFSQASEEAKKMAKYYRSLSDHFRFISIAVTKKPLNEILS